MQIFLHLPKTAGQTLLSIIERQYRPGSVLSLYSSMFGEEVLTMDKEQLEQLQIAVGHFYFGVHTYLPGPSFYFTILREPVDRIISHYYYVKNSPDHYLYQEANRLSLQEYVKFCGRAEPNNDQTRLIAGKDYLPASGEYTEEMLPVAKQNLRNYFKVVGITEEFDRSLLLMSSVLGWNIPFYLKQNVSKHRMRREHISGEMLHTILEHNTLDTELYQFGTVIFQEQVGSLGKSFENKLRLFQLINTGYRKIHRLLSSLTPTQKAG